MAVDKDGNEIADDIIKSDDVIETNDLQVDDLTHENKDLDDRLDALAGIKKPKDETIESDNRKKIQEKSNIDPATGKEKVAASAQPEQRTSARVNPAHTPRAYGKAFKWDVNGNVVNTNTGTIVAANGAERRAFERALPIFNTIQSEADKYKGMYESATQANVVASNLKLTPEEYSIGARIMAAYKADPKKAIDFLVQEAQNNGVDVSDIGAGGSGVSIKTIEDTVAALLDKRLEPFKFITTDRETQETERLQNSEADSVIEEFFESIPDAQIHGDSIAKIMNAKLGTSINEAYWILKSHALEYKLDWTKDLGPQVTALAQAQGTSNNRQPVSQQRKLPPMGGKPNNDSIVARGRESLSGLTSSGDIVKDAMREAGIDVSDL